MALIEPNANLSACQKHWKLRGHVTAYDAIYVQAVKLRGTALVTADGPLARAPGLGIVVHNVRQH